MGVVERAVWVVEHRLDQPLSLAQIARSCGVTPHHLARAFQAATGRSVMRYRRDRRLSEAARALAAGAPDILAVALDAGYGSHEAFTRAFDRPPQAVRATGCLDQLHLTEPLAMTHAPTPPIGEPRRESGRLLRIAGLAERYGRDTNQGIPGQWRRFEPWVGYLTDQVGRTAYGVCVPRGPETFDYVTGVEVRGFECLPEGWEQIVLPPRRYIVFTQEGHVTGIVRTVRTIWDEWLPARGIAVSDAPDFECYDDRFDPETGTGIVEIWIPLAPT
ncbi:MAG: helix-turn-helix domain-containing protein [Alphaproteobacteria bacterium]|jgi:AraC family transcriptional regulator|nr:helix-turn-helix domain-containing protein [Alphaproteobacteria bacterium]